MTQLIVSSVRHLTLLETEAYWYYQVHQVRHGHAAGKGDRIESVTVG